MRIGYENTLDDYREAAELLAATHDQTRLDQRLTAEHFRRHIGGYGASALLAFLWLSMQVAPLFSNDVEKPGGWTFLHLFMPFFATTALAAVARTSRTATDAFYRRTPARWYRRVLLPATAILLVLALLLYLRRYTHAGFDDVRPRSMIDWSSVWPFLLPHVGWIAAMIGAHVDQARARSEWYAEAWDDRAELAASRTLEADDLLVRVTTPTARTEHDWHIFRTFFETPNLFVLLIDEHQYYPVPRRAIPDHEQESRFRDLLQANIKERPVAFPVVPIVATQSPGTDEAHPQR